MHSIVDDVLGNHSFTEPLGADEDDIISSVDEFSGSHTFHGISVYFFGPSPVEIGHGFEAADSAVLVSPGKGAAFTFEELLPYQVFDNGSGGPVLLFCDAYKRVEIVILETSDTERSDVSVQLFIAHFVL
jgi:hypothetical protein